METLAGSYVIGLIGGALFVIAFAGLNFGLLKSDSYIYQGLNFLGGAAFVYTAIKPFNVGLFVTEFVWAVVGLYGIWLAYRTSRRRSEAPTAEEVPPNTPA
ncbi:transporter [Corynebacterium frankenforstense DSM 45800]|uniref:Transporter n=1 Tax=Corynebacterium frankenforstense DSM 45800 TaxID=1437875 RepID=A0A1L7CT59_9CORY|nr:transporter [Corynebacterium frankenforstense]APT89046.1 transporter [Corynebacterium frankenforstense DSM 45800]